MYKIDVWSGELHQKHCGFEQFNDWDMACNFMLEQVEAGNLCNILHSDFIAPAHKREDTEKALFDEYVASNK